MAQVTIEVGGRRYDLGCREGDEARLRKLAAQVDARTTAQVRAAGRGSETRELVMTVLLLADALDDAQARLAETSPLAAAAERCAERIEALADALEREVAGIAPTGGSS